MSEGGEVTYADGERIDPEKGGAITLQAGHDPGKPPPDPLIIESDGTFWVGKREIETDAELRNVFAEFARTMITANNLVIEEMQNNTNGLSDAKALISKIRAEGMTDANSLDVERLLGPL